MSYKNSEVKGKVNEKLDGAMYDAFKLCQAITKNSRTREVIMLWQLCRVSSGLCRSSGSQFYKKGVIKDFVKFTENTCAGVTF